MIDVCKDLGFLVEMDLSQALWDELLSIGAELVAVTYESSMLICFGIRPAETC